MSASHIELRRRRRHGLTRELCTVPVKITHCQFLNVSKTRPQFFHDISELRIPYNFNFLILIFRKQVAEIIICNDQCTQVKADFAAGREGEMNRLQPGLGESDRSLFVLSEAPQELRETVAVDVFC
jgi:hypothetical protein